MGLYLKNLIQQYSGRNAMVVSRTYATNLRVDLVGVLQQLPQPATECASSPTAVCTSHYLTSICVSVFRMVPAVATNPLQRGPTYQRVVLLLAASRNPLVLLQGCNLCTHFHTATTTASPVLTPSQRLENRPVAQPLFEHPRQCDSTATAPHANVREDINGVR
jgi:hypothetical protein